MCGKQAHTGTRVHTHTHMCTQHPLLAWFLSCWLPQGGSGVAGSEWDKRGSKVRSPRPWGGAAPHPRGQRGQAPCWPLEASSLTQCSQGAGAAQSQPHPATCLTGPSSAFPPGQPSRGCYCWASGPGPFPGSLMPLASFPTCTFLHGHLGVASAHCSEVFP